MTHTTGPVFAVSGTTTPTKVIDKYQIVTLEDPSRPAVYASGDLYTFYTTTRESAGDFNFFDFFLPVNGGPPPHVHPFEHEIWHVTHGSFQFNLGDQGTDSIVVPEGTTVFGPIDRTHGYRNLESKASVSGVTEGARTLSMTTPGALDFFFDAAAKRVVDRDQPIPVFGGPTIDDFLNLAKFNARTNAGIILTALRPNYTPPADALPYVLVLPKDATGEAVDKAKALATKPGFSVWTTGDQVGIQKRPTFVGDFGITYTSLVNLQETGNKFSYNEFSLTSQANTNFPNSIVSQEDEVFYVEKGQLTVKIGKEEKTVGPDTYVYIAPGNEYSIVNKGAETVEALAITVIPQEDHKQYIESKNTQNPRVYQNQADDRYPSPLNPLPIIPPSQVIHLSNQDDSFQDTGNPNSYRYLFGDQKGYTDYTVNPKTVKGVTYDGTFEIATINPTTQKLVVDKGLFRAIDGSIADEGKHTVEILPDNNSAAGRKGVITQVFLDSPQDLDTVPDVVKTLPADTKAGLSTTDKVATQALNAPDGHYQYLEIPSQDFAADEFRDKPKAQGGLPIPILGEDWSVEEFESGRRIYAGKGNDEVSASKYDTVYGEQGNDLLDASQGKGGNRLYGGRGNDIINLNTNDRGYGGAGDDLIDASVGEGLEPLGYSGHNLLDGGSGNDTLIAGSNDQLSGGSGNDSLYIREGGNNLLYGGAGKDKFWILDGKLPTDTVKVEYPDSAKSLLPPDLSFPELQDTRNTIMDFRLGVDKIYISGLEDIPGLENVPTSFADLQLLPTFGDMKSTSIIAKYTEGGIRKEISLANVKDLYFNEFTANDFVFV